MAGCGVGAGCHGAGGMERLPGRRGERVGRNAGKLGRETKWLHSAASTSSGPGGGAGSARGVSGLGGGGGARSRCPHGFGLTGQK